ncbi:MAG: hypothetical protein OHK0047_29730 [Leptolyngbyaceae cyanobacterium]|uniref:hypothetical protein n=1 Tax=Leptodesmis sp. TaxID=3100501 RepID=UPI003D1256BE
MNYLATIYQIQYQQRIIREQGRIPDESEVLMAAQKFVDLQTQHGRLKLVEQ